MSYKYWRAGKEREREHIEKVEQCVGLIIKHVKKILNLHVISVKIWIVAMVQMFYLLPKFICG